MVPNLKVLQNDDFETEFNETNDSVLITIKKFKNHPSTVMIKNKINVTESSGKFSCYLVKFNDVSNKKRNLDISKASCKNGITKKVLKRNCDYFAHYL